MYKLPSRKVPSVVPVVLQSRGATSDRTTPGSSCILWKPSNRTPRECRKAPASSVSASAPKRVQRGNYCARHNGIWQLPFETSPNRIWCQREIADGQSQASVNSSRAPFRWMPSHAGARQCRVGKRAGSSVAKAEEPWLYGGEPGVHESWGTPSIASHLHRPRRLPNRRDIPPHGRDGSRTTVPASKPNAVNGLCGANDPAPVVHHGTPALPQGHRADHHRRWRGQQRLPGAVVEARAQSPGTGDRTAHLRASLPARDQQVEQDRPRPIPR